MRYKSSEMSSRQNERLASHWRATSEVSAERPRAIHSGRASESVQAALLLPNAQRSKAFGLRLATLGLFALASACANGTVDSHDPGPPGTAGTSAPPGVGGAAASSGGKSGTGVPQAGSPSNPGPPGGAGTTGSPGTGGTGGTSSMPPGAGPPPTPPPSAPLESCTTPGPRLVRRLTSTQYRNTLVDLFQDEGVPVADAPLQDPSVLGFRIDADAPVIADLTAELLMNYAETVAVWAVKNKKNQISNCTNHDASCWRQFIQGFGTKLQREPLPEDRVAGYVALFEGETTFDAGMEVALTAMLQSPYLLYRRELGQQNGNEYTLTPYEIASELSYFLLDSTPDAGLLQAAADNRLSSKEAIDQEVNRLLAAPEARGPVAQFVQGWLGINHLREKAKDLNVFNLTESLRHAMLGETEEFFFHAFANSGTTSDLFSANYTFANRELAQFYGVSGVNGDAFQRVELPVGTRAPGLLGQAAFLTAHAQPENSSPVQRGMIIRERLLCQDLPPVPADLNTNLAQPGTFASNRDRYQQHSSDPVCSTCHRMMDPVGFALEHYDAFGRYRTMDGNTAIDATGTLFNAPDGSDVPLDGAESLASYLTSNDAVSSCLVRYWSYFAHGRDNWSQKICNHDAVRREASASGYSLRSVLTGLIHAPTFTRRVKDQ